LNENIYRIWYKKSGLIRHTSHRDLINTWYIGLSRARLPVQYTEGFSKKPKVVFGPALPLGVSSDCEYADLYLKKAPESPAGVLERLGRSFPAGYAFYDCSRVETPDMLDIAAKFRSFSYDFTFAFGTLQDAAALPAESAMAALLSSNISSLMASEKFEADNNGKIRDIRPFVISAGPAVALPSGNVAVGADIALIDKSTIKPQLLLKAMLEGIAEGTVYTCRVHKKKINF